MRYLDNGIPVDVIKFTTGCRAEGILETPDGNGVVRTQSGKILIKNGEYLRTGPDGVRVIGEAAVAALSPVEDEPKAVEAAEVVEKVEAPAAKPKAQKKAKK